MNAEDFIYSSYMKALPYIKGKPDHLVRKPELAQRLLSLLGHPEKDLPIILVTGSKGKGSVSRMIAFLLERMGYRSGHFSSPHLIDFTERIRVNGQAIPYSEFNRLAKQLEPYVNEIQATLRADEYISPIAISQAIALLYFREQAVEVGVFEVGRGGTFDDTNVLPHQAAVITPILEEHLEQLGPSLKNVVQHKIGILTNGVRTAYIGKQRDDVWPLIEEQLDQFQNIQIARYGQQFQDEHSCISLDGTKTSVTVRSHRYPEILLPLLGQFQAENFSLAMAVVHDWTNGAAAEVDWNKHVNQLFWPGRCEVIDRNPLVLLDGGVHRNSAMQVRELVEKLPYSRLHVVIGIPRDKDIEGVIAIWANVAQMIITTEATNPHLDFHFNYTELLSKYHQTGRHIPEVEEAISFAKSGLTEKDILVIMGTQSLIADVTRMWGKSLYTI